MWVLLIQLPFSSFPFQDPVALPHACSPDASSPGANTAAPHSRLHIASRESVPSPAPASVSHCPIPPAVSGLAHSTDTEHQCLFLTVTFMNCIVVAAKPFFTRFPDCYSQLPSENCKSHFQLSEPAGTADIPDRAVWSAAACKASSLVPKETADSSQGTKGKMPLRGSRRPNSSQP